MGRPRKIDRQVAEAVAEQRAAMGIVEVEHYDGILAGTVVKIKGIRGNYTIRCFRIDPETEECKWVSVVGGSNGVNEWRSFDLSRIIPPKKKRARVG